MKTVRDGIKELFDRGELKPPGRVRSFRFRQADEAEARQLLQLKIVEELAEVMSARTQEERQDELYDLIDVARALLELEGGGAEAEQRHEAKVRRLGQFKEHWVLY